MLICGRVHWTLTLTSSYSKTFVFDRPHEYDKSPFFLNLQSGERFQKTSVFLAEKAVHAWTGGANGEKNLRFRKYPDTGGWGLSMYFLSCTSHIH